LEYSESEFSGKMSVPIFSFSGYVMDFILKHDILEKCVVII